MNGNRFNLTGGCWAFSLPNRCPSMAESHVLWLDRGTIVQTALCANHAIEFATGVDRHLVTGMHAYRINGSECDMPGTLWDSAINLCIIDDSGVDPYDFSGSTKIVDAGANAPGWVRIMGEDWEEK